jgi:hypothetical protein
MILGLINIAHMCSISVTWKSKLLQCPISSKDAHEMMTLMVMPCYDQAQMMHQMQGKHLGCYNEENDKV